MEKTIFLWKKEEYTYPYAGEFLPNLTSYLHEDEKKRPAVLVVPGGGYAIVSNTEGEIVAKRFFEAGYQAFVLTYTTNKFRLTPLKKQPLQDISRAVRYIRKHADELHVESDKLVCCGFSAGAHLVGSLAVHYQDPILQKDPDQNISNRPDAVLLCYPVITSGSKAHRESFELLLGEQASEEELFWASLENHVTRETPPSFLWQTLNDETVPVDNSIFYMQACRKASVPCELHLFMEGRHGMSLANETWATCDYKKVGIYTMLQHWETLKTLYAQKKEALLEKYLPAARAETLEEFAVEWIKADSDDPSSEPAQPDEAVAQWISMAFAWLDKVI